MSTAELTTLTADDLLALPDAVSYELVGGQLVERNVSTETSWIGGQFYRQFAAAGEDTGIGWAFPADEGYQCFADPLIHVRKADASFIKRDRLPGGPITKGYQSINPDLVVEVVSPNDTAWEVAEKAELWLSAGVEEVWIVMPPTRSVTVHRQQTAPKTLEATDEITCENLIPGFSHRVADFFPPVESPA